MTASFSYSFQYSPANGGNGFGGDTNGRDPAFRRTSTRADLLEAVHATCPSMSRAQAREIFETALEEVSNALAGGETVKLRSFGLFAVREKRERIGRNPRTGVEVPITPRRVLTFKPSPVLLDQVNRRDADPAMHSGRDRQPHAG